MDTTTQKRNKALGSTLVRNLQTRQFEAYYCETSRQAIAKVISLVPEKSTVSWGGSVSIRNMGLTKAFTEGSYHVINRDLATSSEEKWELDHKTFMADYFITSTNAISEEGILINIDGFGNRVAALCYGPKNVIVVCGINKVAANLTAAISRGRNTAAPLNATRLMGKTPCVITGTCQDCKSSDCICNQIVITRFCRPIHRIKIVIVGENLGY